MRIRYTELITAGIIFYLNDLALLTVFSGSAHINIVPGRKKPSATWREKQQYSMILECTLMCGVYRKEHVGMRCLITSGSRVLDPDPHWIRIFRVPESGSRSSSYNSA